MSKARIGFVGVGSMGQCAHLRNYVTVPECEVVAIAELRPKLAQAVATKYGIPKVYGDYNEMIAKEKLDGIVASQWFNLHGTLLPKLLRAGIPIFTEKPLAGSVEQGEKVVAAVAQSGTWHMVGYHKRSDPATMWAKAEIKRLQETQELGALRYVRVTMPPGDWATNGFLELLNSDDVMPPLEVDPPASDMDKATYDEYNALVNYYIHQINLAAHLLGEPYQVTYADPGKVVLAGISASGVSCIIEMAPYETSVDWQESALVGFQHGYVKLELPAPMTSNRPGRVEVLRDPGNGVTPTVMSPQLPWIHAMRQQAMNFVAAIKGERAPMCTAAEALADLKNAREYIHLLKGV
jgi:predicted dehydrogenase